MNRRKIYLPKETQRERIERYEKRKWFKRVRERET
jgi:hypothetical protein